MHFWINKPAGRSHVIGGCRRGTYHAAAAAVTASSLPASIPLLKTRGQLGGRRDCLGGGSMISPHRPSTNWIVNSSTGEQRRIEQVRCQGHSRRTEETGRNNRRGQQTNTISHLVTTSAQPRRVISSDPNANGAILEFPEMRDAELAGYRLRCGVWITFVLASGFVSIAKFYFGNRPDTGPDVLIFCGLLLTLLISGCFFTITRRARNAERNQNNHQEVCPHHVCYYAVNSAELRPQVQTLRVPMPAPTPPPISPSPPPYHIAILIPQAEPPDVEAPPPSYDKATGHTGTTSVSE
ncbi:uncharacterized protein LOC107036604 isoform X1 [Diachasma alloeum]|uniref:uncharacterized protein LOC107036604 isoform X1 n=1 Tax=Diachasma alloeum TaxID=454923 RepID=UPI0007383011|nr:uncharacterized protein LOC107036604 isoform X1 [Diachasma alloeum]